MELGLRLGEAPAGRAFWSPEKAAPAKGERRLGLVLGMGLGVGRGAEEEEGVDEREEEEEVATEEKEIEARGSAEPQLQLNLLPLLPVPSQPSPLQIRFPWASETSKNPNIQKGNLDVSMRGFDVNRAPSAEEVEEGAAASSSPNSTVSSFPMEFSAARGSGERGEAGGGASAERASSRASDEDENALARKKLRLSKEQSAFLEESFKEHNTLNPKQKLALAKQLNLRPRQVEVWFQNRRARTKLKQTEVDCEYLKRCCQTLTEENRRLQKEVAELRALKTSHPFYMHLPATTLSMCPSCERVASSTTTSSAANNTTAGDHRPNSFAALFSKPRPFPLGSQPAPAAPRQPSPVS
ncbi:homeobox-leucine zipper protein HOX11-like [Canna indica]|uniref:Homeobox-leucine zipper protein HOX11-like n=1 Tax=Canna indica TaxID=4628 RepID=A0AAQ3L4C7_9LILI|nr:homeobox-leucine zipper protein HOX11-like [Canna indica]